MADALKTAFGTPDEAPVIDLELGLVGPQKDQLRSLASFLVQINQNLAPVIDALEADGSAAAKKIAQALSPARNSIDGAVYLIVVGDQ
jgi:hypothetical protein